MSLFGSGRSEERRRRVLTEEVMSGAARCGVRPSESARSAGGKADKNRYGDAARYERQLRVSDLIPKSYGMQAVWFVPAASILAALEALHYFLPQWLGAEVAASFAPFDLAKAGNLAAWYSSFLLTAAAAAALIVWSVRKHRSDDYHARYRIWIVAAGCGLLMSADVVAGLHGALRDAAIRISGTVGPLDGAVWWIGAYCVLLGGVGLRLTLEMKECRTSTAVLLTAGACFVAAVLTHVGVLRLGEARHDVMLEAGLKMGGDLLLLTAMTLHARYVVLEAAGEIVPRAAAAKTEKPKSRKTTVEDDGEQAKSTGIGWFRRAKIDPAHGTPAPAGRTSDLEPATKIQRVPSTVFHPLDESSDDDVRSSDRAARKSSSSYDDEDDGSHRDNRKLSKAERKAMRRQKEMERRYGDE